MLPLLGALAIAMAGNQYLKSQEDKSTLDYKGLLEQDMAQQGINPAMGRFEGQPVPTPYTDAGNMTPNYAPTTGMTLNMAADPRYQPVADRLLQEQGALGRTGLQQSGEMSRQLQKQEFEQGLIAQTGQALDAVNSQFPVGSPAYGSPQHLQAVSRIPGIDKFGGAEKVLQSQLDYNRNVGEKTFENKLPLSQAEIDKNKLPPTPYQTASLAEQKRASEATKSLAEAQFGYMRQGKERELFKERTNAENQLKVQYRAISELSDLLQTPEIKSALNPITGTWAIPTSNKANVNAKLDQYKEQLSARYIAANKAPGSVSDIEMQFYRKGSHILDSNASGEYKLRELEKLQKNMIEDLNMEHRAFKGIYNAESPYGSFRPPLSQLR